MESNFTHEFHNSALQPKAGDNCLRQQTHFQQNWYHAIAICVVNLPLCLAALVGNSAILIAIKKTPTLHSPANVLLAGLAISDFAVGLIVEPLLLTLLLPGTYGLTPSTYRVICLIYDNAAYILCGVSFHTITATGVDRFLALQLHLRYNSIITTSRAILAVIAIWLWLGFWSVLWLEGFDILPPTAIAVFLLLIVNFAIYLKIHLIVRRHQKQIQHQQLQTNNGNIFRIKMLKKSTLNTFLIFILMICCYVPITSLLATGHGRTSFTALFITSTIVFLNSSLNPLLYCWRVREIRAAIKQLFCH